MAKYTVTLDDENPPLFDLGHEDINTQANGSVVVGKTDLPDGGGTTGWMTVRLPNVTLMIPLDRAGVAAWKAKLDELDRALAATSGLIVPGTPHLLPGMVRPG